LCSSAARSGRLTRIICTHDEWCEFLRDVPRNYMHYVDLTGHSEKLMGLPLERRRTWNGPHVVDEQVISDMLDRRKKA
jgi:hypothetical protein